MTRPSFLGRCLRITAAVAIFGAVAPSARAQVAPSGATPPGAVGADSKSDENRESLDAAKLSKVPKQTKFVEAEYPPEANAQGIEAEVTLLLDINDKGFVDSVSVAEANPPGMGFEEAAMIAAQGFEFEPAEMAGKPIAVQLGYKYRFTLKPKPEETPATDGQSPTPGDPSQPQPAKPAKDLVINFSGLLLERGTREPMAGVIVTVFRDDVNPPVGFEATTDEKGNFAFYDLPEGAWKVLVEVPGYYPFRTTEEIQPREAIRVTYYGERASYNPYDVTVTASRPRKEVSRTVISAKEIDKVPGTAGDPLAVIQNFAGVARTPAFSGQIIVRGSAPEDTRVFVDGVEVPLIYHFGGLRSVLPIGMLDGIDFYPGNFAPQYGRATGGVIDVRTKRSTKKQINGYADISVLDTGLYLEIPFAGDKGSIAIAGRRSYIDFIINALVPEDASVNVVAAPRYYDYQLLASYRPNPAHDLRFFFFGSDDQLKLLFNNPADLDVAVTGNTLSATTSFYRSATTWRYVPNTSFSNTLRVSQGRNWINFSVGNLIFDLNVYVSQIRNTIEQKLSERIALRYGADFLFSRASGFIRLPLPPKEGEPVGNLDFSRTQTADFSNNDFYEPALFAEAEVRVTDKLLFLPGLRADYFSQVSESIVQPRATARYSLTETITLKGGAGLFAQAPQPDETSKDFGNPDLKGERARHYSAGAEYRPLPHLTFDVTGFYKDLYSQVSRTDVTVPAGQGQRALVYDNKGEGRVYGMEAVIRHEFTNKFSGWLAYTLSRAERTDSGALGARRFDFDQPHILTVIGSYLLPRNWQIGSRFRLVSGNPRTPVVGAVYNASTDRYDPRFGDTNSARLGSFHQLDVRIDKRWIYDRWMLNVYLDVQNTYNRSNPEGLQYNYNYRLARAQQGLPLLTILGIRAEF